LCCALKDDPIGNLNTAFEVAEKYLDIPKMLDAEGERKIASELRSKSCNTQYDRLTFDTIWQINITFHIKEPAVF